MKAAIFAVFAMLVMACSGPALAQLDRITNQDAVAGLRAALEKGSGRGQGARPQRRLPRQSEGEDPASRLPTRAESLMRRVGMGSYADELIVAMNRAAESAVPEARRSSSTRCAR